MGNLIKINMYVERNKINGSIINIKKLEENISDYSIWLKNNNREDKIDNYERFLEAQ